MRAIQFGKWLVAVLAGAIYTIIQTGGPDPAEQAFCRLIQKGFHSVSDHCVPGFQNWGPKTALGIAVLFGILAIWDIVSWIRKRRAGRAIARASSSARFIGVIEAIYWIAERSAWGRWMEAQYRVSGKAVAQIFKLTTAEQLFRRSAENGEIVVKARLAKSVDYTALDQHFWHSAYFHIEENLTSIWAATIKARSGGIEIPEYDAAIVERTRVEALWRQRDWRYDWPRLRLNIETAWKRMKDPPKTESGEESTKHTDAAPAPSPPTTQVIAQAGIGVETTAETAASASPNVEITVADSALENWERLFTIGDDGRSVWLKFLPDNKNYKSETLLLIVYGHKVLLGNLRVRVNAAHLAVSKTISAAPNKPNQTLEQWALGPLAYLGNEDYFQPHVSGYLKRVALAKGGMYELTEVGEQRARGIAYDLISRSD